MKLKVVISRELIGYKLSVHCFKLEMRRFLTTTALCLTLSIRNRKQETVFKIVHIYFTKQITWSSTILKSLSQKFFSNPMFLS